jgi:hypothetical protein
MPPRTLKDELIEAARQLELEEKEREDAALSEDQRKTATLAATLIELSRDMRRPGSSFSEAGRIDRLLRTVKED